MVTAPFQKKIVVTANVPYVQLECLFVLQSTKGLKFTVRVYKQIEMRVQNLSQGVKGFEEGHRRIFSFIFRTMGAMEEPEKATFLWIRFATMLKKRL